MKDNIYFLAIVLIAFFIILLPADRVASGLGNVSPASNFITNVEKGKILFNYSKYMTVDKVDYVTLKLTKDNISNGEDILLSKYMTAALSGKDFDIDSLNHAEQQIPNNGFATWEWRVIPRSEGSQVLELLVSIRAKIPGDGEELQDYPVLRREVIVRVDRGYWIKNYLVNNWIGLLVAFFGGVFSIIALISAIFREDIRDFIKKRIEK